MNFTKKIDRAFQWAGEKMGNEAKTSMSDDFKNLESEMNLRHDGMERLQRSMTAFVKYIGRRGDTFDDGEKGLPVNYLGRAMINHGEDFEPDSEFGGCLTSLGRANERLASAQERFVADATTTWLESLERSLAMMKEYQAARKKLENRRLAYDASITKMQKTKRDDFRVEEELRSNRAKYEESSEDVYRRMQDVKESESESIRDLTGFLDCELEFHERCAEELRRVKRTWPGAATAASVSSGALSTGYSGRSRSNTARSYNNSNVERTPSHSSGLDRLGRGRDAYPDEPEPMPVRMPIISRSRANSSTNVSSHSPPGKPMRPIPDRNNSLQPPVERPRYGGSGTSTPISSYSNGSSANPAAAAVASLRSGLRPVGRTQTGGNGHAFGDDVDETTSGGSGSPEWGERSASPATSYDSLSRSTSNVAARKPPPPPPNRSKKPPPPPAPRREANH